MTFTSLTTTDTALTGITGWAVDLMETLGAPGAGVAIAVENLFPPLPSELLLPLAGFTASLGELSLVAVIVWTTVGSLAGALAWYTVGAMVGRDRTRALLARLPLVNVTDVDRAESWFARHGATAVLLGRLVPIVRTFISVPAGVERMPVLSFAALTVAGSAVWNATLVLVGYQLGERWDLVERYAGIVQKGVIAAVAVAVVGFVVLRVAQRGGRHAREGAGQDPR